MRRLVRQMSSSNGFFELRSDRIRPGALSAYLEEVQTTAAARRRVLPGLLGMWKTEIGGSVTSVHHLYHWKDYSERDETRNTAADDPIFYGTVSKTSGVI